MENRFDTFVNDEIEKKTQEENIDHAAEKELWLAKLRGFYDQVETYLADYIKAGKISIEYEAIKIHEEGIGSYEANQATITIGSKKIKLEPIGTMLIGSKGRIDMQSDFGGTMQWVLVDKKAKGFGFRVSTAMVDGKKTSRDKTADKPEAETEWAWKLAVYNGRTVDYIDLSKDLFLDTLMEVANV